MTDLAYAAAAGAVLAVGLPAIFRQEGWRPRLPSLSLRRQEPEPELDRDTQPEPDSRRLIRQDQLLERAAHHTQLVHRALAAGDPDLLPAITSEDRR